jgi:hypothetical protein
MFPAPVRHQELRLGFIAFLPRPVPRRKEDKDVAEDDDHVEVFG